LKSISRSLRNGITAGAETVIKIIQDKYSPDSAFYIGKGKAEEAFFACRNKQY